MECCTYDIFLADYPYEDVVDSKPRPVLILGDYAYAVDCLKMTSRYREGDYLIKDWMGAGLLHETTIRVSKRILLDKNKLRKKIGRLTAKDIIEIRKLIYNK